MTSGGKKKADLRKMLLDWYRENKRDLPWRRTKDPYKIWISEVMLQQTRVDTVIPYYDSFLKKFPTVEKLARSSRQDVLKRWEGLGYYRRAHHLHDAAKEIVQTYKGHLPQSAEDLRKVKGFGPYTSGAVASIAFGEAVPAVDGNVRRVLSRIFATHEPVDQIAGDLVPHSSPSDFNQSLMELGARVCTPKNPNCSECPVNSQCLALSKKEVSEFPKPSQKAKPKRIYASIFIIQKGNSELLSKRNKKGRWEEMWEYPTVESEEPLQFKKWIELLEKEKNLELSSVEPVGRFRHLLTHRDIQANVLKARLSNTKVDEGFEWVKPRNAEELPRSRFQQKARDLVREA